MSAASERRTQSHLTLVGGATKATPKRSPNLPVQVKYLTTYLEAIGLALDELRTITDFREVQIYLDAMRAAVVEGLEYSAAS